MANLIPFRKPANGPAGLLLALNADQIVCVTSGWDKERKQNVLRIHLANTRVIVIFEEDAVEVLEALDLDEYVDDWTLNLMRDV